MWRLARTPRWIAALIFALVVAAGFAALGQWQLSRAVASGTVVERPTETVVPLESIAQPQQPVTDTAAGQMASVTGAFVPGTATILTGRLNGGVSGYWVVAELATGDASSERAGLVVALGWSADKADAASALSQVDAGSAGDRQLTGRFISGEDPTEDDFENGQHSRVSVGALINEWDDPPAAVYGGYLVDSVGEFGLTAIDSPKPSTDVSLNLLNVFYAVEWVVFAGLAVFMWYRLLKDAWERQLEEEAEQLEREPQLN